jgi:putative nucleotidyltransferase with HDIG domain
MVSQPSKSFLRSYRVKVTLAMIFSILFVMGLSNALIYRFMLDSKFDSIRSRLMVIAQTAALLVDTQTLSEIPLTHEGIHSPAYQTVAKKLNRVRLVNPQITYIYVMAKTPQEGIWQFIVDPDALKQSKSGMSLPGDQYNAARFPEMMKAFDVPSADQRLEIDEWGATLSGYAPIRNENGQAAAMLGIDMKADDLYLIQKEVHQRARFVLALGVLLSFIVGFFISRRITGSVKELVRGIRHISQGDLQCRVNVSGDDEVAELATAFNQMAKSLHQSRRRINSYFYSVVRSLIRILELRDHYTKGHSERVADYASKIAEKWGFPKETVKMLRRITLLHDIGKIGIRDSILHKKDTLTQEEWITIKQHPTIGENILKPILVGKDFLSIVKHHHERFDGKGYPDQLNKDSITTFAAIVAAADAFDAMTSDRSYRRSLSRAQAMEELKKNSGSQFDPKVVDIFLKILKEEEEQG